MSKIHITEKPDIFPTPLLCGRTVATKESRWGQVAMAAIVGWDPSDIWSLQEKQSVFVDVEWISVPDFIKGDDSPNCLSCRNKLNSALDRYWGDD